MIIDRVTAIRVGVVATLAFAAAHVYWGVGGTAGVPTGEPITGRPVFLAYDIASAVVLLVAAGVASRMACAPTRLLTRLTVAGASIALFRGLIGLTQSAVTVAGGHELTAGAGYDVWFAGVGALFLAVGLGRQVQAGGSTRTRSSPDAGSAKPRLR